MIIEPGMAAFVTGAGLVAWLATRAGGPPRWNFHKFLVARDGATVRSFPTSVEPENATLLRAVEAALAGRPLA